MGARDVRDRRLGRGYVPFHTDERSQTGLACAAIQKAGDETSLFGHRDQVLEHIRKRLREREAGASVRVAVLPTLDDVRDLGIEQPFVADRRRVAAGEELVLREVVFRRRLVREGGRQLLPDAILMLTEHGDLVPRAELPRQARVEASLDQWLERPAVEIRLVGPLGRVAGILVLVQAGDIALRPLPPGGGVEPQLVLDDRAAGARVHVVDNLERIGRPQPRVLQFIGEVVRLPALVRSGGKEGPLELVATFTRNQVHLDAAERLLGAAR